MKKLTVFLGVSAVALASVGCAARSDNIYAEDVQKVIEARGDGMAACHSAALKSDPGAQGTVMVSFKVMEDTGEFTDVKVDPAGTTAPESLQQCVTSTLPSLKLEPGDNRPAMAKYEIVFPPAAGGAVAAAPPAEEGGDEGGGGIPSLK